MSFEDHFGPGGAQYARHRPRYPRDFAAFVARIAPARRVVWDAACGTGQAARDLARHFDRVVATDASAGQLAPARPAPALAFARALCEEVPIGDRRADAVVVTQALHWLDRPRFYAEVRRVLRPRGVIVAACYELPSIADEIDAELQNFHDVIVGPHWPPARRLITDAYRGIDFPFEQLPTPPMTMQEGWCVDDLLGHLSSWSAVLRARAATGEDPLPPFAERLRELWRRYPARLPVRWPLTILAGRVDPARRP